MPIAVNRVGQTLMGLVNVLQDAPGSSEEKEIAVSCLFNMMTKTNRKELSTLRKRAWEFNERADNVLHLAKGLPQFYAAEQYIKNDLRGI